MARGQTTGTFHLQYGSGDEEATGIRTRFPTPSAEYSRIRNHVDSIPSALPSRSYSFSASTQLPLSDGNKSLAKSVELRRREKRAGHPYKSRAPAKQKKPRTSFTKKQVALLETRFLDQKYLASAERAHLASQLNMSDSQVKTWFQNRRTKWRRQEAEEREFEDKAAVRMLSTYGQCFFARPDITL
ncbi:hypothetical protein QR680_001744 [Steinernema hermaphroditum]|uniref:Homeobox domain-containing protein n=1 Tax=Steinernema hermaphroditum TaxID=289476 RepID=A0AA39H1C5_9BILA|nr:hypothetical protein QR680_001744 [Steinernema hermaphroditum]